MGIGQQLLNVPFAEMVSSLGLAIAEAQQALDKNSIEILKLMGEENTVSLPFVSVTYASKEKGGDGSLKIEDREISTSMIGAGFQPTFYQFAETIIEVKMAISMSYESTSEKKTSTTEKSSSKKGIIKKKTVTTASSVDATYSSKYNYSAEGSSLLRTRLVPVPPNAMVSQIIEMRNQAMEKYFEIEMAKCSKQIEQASAQMEKDSEKEAEIEENKK